MAVLNADKRKSMPQGEFAGPNRTFPVNDKTHQRLAISGASRAEHAGNISHSEAEHIKSEARSRLHEGGGDPHGHHADPPEHHRAAIAKMHPGHLHRLVERAHAGEFGPEAQQAAHEAMSSAGEGGEAGEGMPGERPDSQIGNPQSGATMARQMFGSRPGEPEEEMSPGEASEGQEDYEDDQDGSGTAARIFGGRR